MIEILNSESLKDEKTNGVVIQTSNCDICKNKLICKYIEQYMQLDKDLDDTHVPDVAVVTLSCGCFEEVVVEAKSTKKKIG